MQRAVRGRLVSFAGDPAETPNAVRYWPDGIVAIDGGRIVAMGDAQAIGPTLPPATPVDHYPEQLVMPGFIDTHIHYVQIEVIASFGLQLLDWLEKYTFIAEQKFADPAFAAKQARFFIDELLRNGTTTALVYCSVHPQSADALFAEAERRGVGLAAGKVMMDRNAPEALRDDAVSSYRDSKALIERWHKRGRLRYAITPRFVVTSTPEQLEAAAALLREHPDCYLQSHLSENLDEIAAVRRAFPDSASYTDVYDRFGLLGPTTVLGHCIHLSEEERALLSHSRSVAAFCPTSNLFLGSGLFDYAAMTRKERPVRVSLATDVGGGTSYSMLQTAAAAYQVFQLRGNKLSAYQAFHMMTRGNALALGLEQEIGTLAPGRYADLVVLDACATPAMRQRMTAVNDRLDEELFVLMIMGDDRAVAATYVQGERIVLDAVSPLVR
ncbi:MAG TPA: guanine deaminase [Xanthobacteraceae bacterium]|nr:guanine deaminase [Xanthobacteraceae bacterium]